MSDLIALRLLLRVAGEAREREVDRQDVVRARAVRLGEEEVREEGEFEEEVEGEGRHEEGGAGRAVGGG